MTHVPKSWFINIIYDHTEVFSLNDEDLRFCDWIKHTILTTLDKPVYLPHHIIPIQLQGEVHKCLDTWFWQGIIRPSQSPYASQVVIVHKKKQEKFICAWISESIIQLWWETHFHYQELMKPCRLSTVVTGFLLSTWHRGTYLQLAMEESDIKRLHLEPVWWIYTSLLKCHLDSKMQALVSVT